MFFIVFKCNYLVVYNGYNVFIYVFCNFIIIIRIKRMFDIKFKFFYEFKCIYCLQVYIFIVVFFYEFFFIYENIVV